MDKWDKAYKLAKIIALFVPSVLTVVVLIVVLINIKGNVTCLEAVDLKLNIGLAIIGIAISVWVGLNIYNVIERKQIDELEKMVDKLQTELKDIEPKLQNFEKSIEQEQLERFFLSILINWSQYSGGLKEALIDSSLDNYKNIYYLLPGFVTSFIDLVDVNKELMSPHEVEYKEFILKSVLCGYIILYNIKKLEKDIDRSGKAITKAEIENELNNILNGVKQIIEDNEDEIANLTTGEDIEMYENIKANFSLIGKMCEDEKLEVDKENQIQAITSGIDKLITKIRKTKS